MASGLSRVRALLQTIAQLEVDLRFEGVGEILKAVTIEVCGDDVSWVATTSKIWYAVFGSVRSAIAGVGQNEESGIWSGGASGEYTE